MKKLRKTTSLFLVFVLTLSIVIEFPVSVKAAEEFADGFESLEQILEDRERFLEEIDEFIGFINDDIAEMSDFSDDEISEIAGYFEQISAMFDNDIQQYADGEVFTPAEILYESPKVYAQTTVKVGARTVKNAVYNPTTGVVWGDFLTIFRGLGGRVSTYKNKKVTEAVMYELNGIKMLYPADDDPKNEVLTVAAVMNMFGVSEYFQLNTKETFNKKKYGETPCITVTFKKIKAFPKAVKPSQSVSNFMSGVGNAVATNMQSGFWNWVMTKVTGRSVSRPPSPSSLKDPKAYYLGRVVGHALSIAIGAGEVYIGLSLISGSIGAGAFTTLMSGGTLVVGGVAVSVAGVTVGGAAVADGSLVVANALYNMGSDMSKLKYHSTSGGKKQPGKITYDNKKVGDKWGEHKKDYPNLKDHNQYKNLANKVFSKPDRVIFDPQTNQWYYTKGKDLLRLTPDGHFVSLYPGADSDTVINAIMAALS